MSSIAVGAWKNRGWSRAGWCRRIWPCDDRLHVRAPAYKKQCQTGCFQILNQSRGKAHLQDFYLTVQHRSPCTNRHDQRVRDRAYFRSPHLKHSLSHTLQQRILDPEKGICKPDNQSGCEKSSMCSNDLHLLFWWNLAASLEYGFFDLRQFPLQE